MVAINIKQNNTDSLYFVDSDHLGSILALLKTDGSVAEEYSYDSWGRRRNPADWSYTVSTENLLTDRGFTGHEHYDAFELIDMNGRIYDPVIGRFLSPDPVIQSPDFTQSYNSYSYCFNNPLKYTDPSGYNVYHIRKENWAKILTQGEFFNADFLGREYGDLIFDDSDSNFQELLEGGGTYGPLGVYNFTATDGTKINVLTYNPTRGDFGEFRIEIRAKGDYSTFNLIQSYFENNTWKLDDKYSGDHGFYYSRYWSDYYTDPKHDPWYTKGFDSYFWDQPNRCRETPFQSTICGLKEEWILIFTISWHYNINNGKLEHEVNSSVPESGHQENINSTLEYWHHHEF